MSLSLNHLHLHTRDLRRSVAFYSEHLGWSVKADFGTLVFLDDGNGFDLALLQDEGGDELPAWFHFGCRLEDAAAVRAAYARMDAAGLPIARPLQQEDTGYVTFTVADPDGARIEIYYDPGLVAAG